jgi:hypothetical protein
MKAAFVQLPSSSKELRSIVAGNAAACVT